MRPLVVDTRDLAPPEPMQAVLAALAALAPDEYVVMRHRREPVPLYAVLTELGFARATRRAGAGLFEVVIWRADGPRPPQEAPPHDAPGGQP